MLQYLTQLTQDESDFIESVLKWDDETKAAFMFAKRIFEEDDRPSDETTRTIQTHAEDLTDPANAVH